MKAMTCGRARRLAWGDPDELVMSVERAGAQAHIARCPACQRFVAAMRRFRRALGAARGTETAPLPLRLRVRDALGAAHRQQARRRIAGRFAVGLAAALALVALGARLLTVDETHLVRRIVQREAALLNQSGIESSDPRGVHDWLVQRLPYEVHVPEFLDARLTGAAISAIDGRPSAVLRFQVGDRHIAYVISPTESTTEDSTLRPQHEGGLAVVSWRMPGLLHVWIGPIPVEHLASLARRCTEQARAAASASSASFTTPARA